MSSPDHSSLGPFLTNSFGDRYLYSVNREAFNRVGAETIFRQRFNQVLEQKNTLHVFVGLDSGLLLEFVRKEKLPEGVHCLFVELPEVLGRLKEEGCLDNLGDQISCSLSEDFLARLKSGAFREYFSLDRVQLWQSLAAEDAHLPEYVELQTLTRDKFTEAHYQFLTTVNKRMFIQRQFDNLADNRINASVLNGHFNGKTAVLLAGGPSLDLILPWVKTHRKNLVLLAVSRIARRLQEVELVPDIICSIDPQQISFDVSKEMLLLGKQTLFLNLYHVSTPLLSNWQGRSFFAGPCFPWKTPLNIQPNYSSGPTVTNFALQEAIAMGFSQIILGGVDLCFSREGYSHARGSYEAQTGPRFNIVNETRIETNSGWMAPTTQAMAQAALNIDKQAAAAREQGCRIVTTVLDAAKISNVEYLHQNQIDLPSLDHTAWQTLVRRLPEDSSSSRVAHYQATLEELNRGKDRMQEIGKLCELALKYNDGLFGRGGLKKNFKYKKKLDGIEKQLNRDYQDFVSLIKEFGLTDFVKLASPTASENWSDEEIEAKGRRYYQVYKESAQQLSQLIVKTIERLKLRLEEDQETTDFKQLVQGWNNYMEPGRALLWRKRHPKKVDTFSKETRQELMDTEQTFVNLLSDQKKEANTIDSFKADAHPEHARKKALFLFRRRDVEALQVLHRGLSVLDEDEAAPVRHLIAGNLAELAAQPEQALVEYHAVVNEEFCSSTEEALRRIVSISLKLQNTDYALLGLECLSNISPVYLPQYADLLKLLGDTKQALDLYANYLDKIPGDPLVLMRVGKLYQELGMNQEALTVFRYLCEQDPSDSLFRTLVEKLEAAVTNS